MKLFAKSWNEGGIRFFKSPRIFNILFDIEDYQSDGYVRFTVSCFWHSVQVTFLFNNRCNYKYSWSLFRVKENNINLSDRFTANLMNKVPIVIMAATFTILSIILLNEICFLLEVWLKVSQATAVLFTLAGSLLLTFLFAHFQDRKIVSSKRKLEKIVESVKTSVLKVTKNSTPPIAPIGWDRVPRFQGEEKSSNRKTK